MLTTHPDFRETPGLSPEEKTARRLKLCDFFVQAGWFDDADQELTRLLQDFPDQKERVTAVQEAVDRIRSRERFESIKTAAPRGPVRDGGQTPGPVPRKKRQ